jgi:hypothetical protein
MRFAFVTLIAAAGLAISVMAQPADTTVAAPADAAPTSQTSAPPPPPAPSPATPAPALNPPPAVPAQTLAPPGTPAPAPAPAPPEAPPAPPPPQPPAPPTDPTTIAVLSTLDRVCVPSANGGSLAQIAKAQGFRKSGDNWVMKQREYQLTILSTAGNPTQCQVEIVHPIDPEAPAKPIVIALHNWAAVERDWSLYRNDKSVIGASEFTTRSWEHTADGKHEALVLTTTRRADGSPARSNADTSEMIYGVTPAPPAS